MYGCDSQSLRDWTVVTVFTTVRWWQRGFSSPTRRNLMGQVDGTANLAVEDPLFDEVVWSADTQPEWLRGGSYVAVRRIRSPTRSDPNAGHMDCGWSCGPFG